MKINKTNVEKLPATTGGNIGFYFDDEVKGFGVRVSGTTKTYIVQKYIGGKKTRIKLGRHGEISAESARKKALRYIGQMVDGFHPEAEEQRKVAQAITLNEVFADYIKARKADGGLRDKTVAVYQSALRRCFGDWLAKPVSEITKDLIVSRFEEIATTEGPRSKKGGAKAQAAQAMRTLKALLSFASAKYEGVLIEKDPVEKLSRLHRGWSKVARRTEVIDPADMKAWYSGVMQLENDTMRDYLLFCLFTGLRRSAAAKLTWSAYNRTSGIITIPAEDDKTNKVQRLPLPDFVCQILDQRRNRIPLRIDSGKDYIFPDDPTKSTRRGPGHAANVGFIQEPKRAIAKVVAKSGVKFSMHTLRRTYATTASRLDIAYYKLKALLNHSVEADVTGRNYVQVDAEQLREPMQKICDYLRDKCGASASFGVQIQAISHPTPYAVRGQTST